MPERYKIDCVTFLGRRMSFPLNTTLRDVALWRRAVDLAIDAVKSADRADTLVTLTITRIGA